MEIFCQKLQRKGKQLARKPVPGELGDRIYKHISQEAWDMWLTQQTILLNEYRLSSFEPETKKFIQEQMEKFLFEDENITPQAYTPK